MNWYEQMTGKMTPDRFAQRLIDELWQAGDERRVTFDAHRFQLRFAGDGQATGVASLRNLFEEYKRLGSGDRVEFFRFAVRALLAAHKPIPDEFEDARCDILLTVRNRSYFSLPDLRNELAASRDEGAMPLSWPYQSLGDQLGIGLVYDLPEAMMMLQSSHLDDWGVSFYEVFESALANLAELDATFATIDDRSYVSNSGDHYDASRMILAELMAELEVKGDPIVLLPNRDRMIVTGSEDRGGLEASALICRQLIEHPRPISGQAFIRQDGEWRAWLPAPDHPAFTMLKSLSLSTMQTDYLMQQQILDVQRHARTAAPKAATFRVHESGTQQPPFSYCVWQEGASQWLPKTDRVCFVRANESTDHPLIESLNVSWQLAIRVVPDRMREDGEHYPPRFRTIGFPDAKQWERLSAEK